MARLLLALEQIDSNDMPRSTARYFEPYRTVITPGTMISGGISVNVVPDQCEALVDISLTPEYDQRRIDALLDDCLRTVTQDNPRRKLSYDWLSSLPAAN